MEDDVKQQIRQFVLENAQGKGITELSDTDSLVTRGIIDSLGIFRLVSFLEEAFGLRITDEEIVFDNFQTINDIDRFVTTKLGAGKTATRA
jgi:acyl carrier protein